MQDLFIEVYTFAVWKSNNFKLNIYNSLNYLILEYNYIFFSNCDMKIILSEQFRVYA